MTMSAARSESGVAAPSPSAIVGVVDAVEGRRVLGWAWNRVEPGERLLIRVSAGGEVLASAPAALMRVDLRRNGIGDGRHAFEVELPEEAAVTGLSVEAVRPATGESVALPMPEISFPTGAPAGRELALPSDTAVSAALGDIERLFAAQERIALIQEAAAEALRRNIAKVDEAVRADGVIASHLEAMRQAQEEMDERIGDAERCLLRMDATLVALDRQARALLEAADRPMRRAALVIGAVTSASAISSLALLALALFRHSSI
jgi:hypothetical protein